jgi:hypothetical protein
LTVTAADIFLTFIERVDGVVIANRPISWEHAHRESKTTVPFLEWPATKALLSSFPKVVEKVATVSFDGIGSFWIDSGNPSGQPVLGGLRLNRDEPPFTTFADYVTPRIHQRLEELQTGRTSVLWHHPGVFYLSYLELLDLVNNDPDMSQPEPMYLDHADDWQCILDNDQTHIKSIIDWEV